MNVETPLLNGIRPPGNSFVLPEQKMVYISVTKVACTSLRWMVADLAGEDLASFYPAIGAQQTRLMTIHTNRDHWQKSPQIKNTPPEILREIHPDNGWFVFACVRDPWSRLWSAWQSKFLVRHAFYSDNYADEPWFPRVPAKPSDVVEDFAAFVKARPWETHELLQTDWHFQPQVSSVRPEGVNYSRVYDLHEFSTLTSDIRAHLERIGQPRELYLPRANETPLGLTREALSDGVAEVVEDAYRADFDAFGETWGLGNVKYVEDGWTSDAIDHAAYHTAANERIGDIRREARRYRRELEHAQRENERLRARLARAQSSSQDARSLVEKVRTRLSR
ncbi:MAG: sulfotransferase family 2 domain-containing protein [Nocardioidaceae bacterium]